MNTYIITYDLCGDPVPPETRTRTAVSEALIDMLRRFGSWAHITESCWAVVSNRTAIDIRDEILALVRPQDRIMVVQTAHVAAWNNALCNNEWLRANI